jgi:RNA polymerase sigma factor (TIGR02999 family)
MIPSLIQKFMNKVSRKPAGATLESNPNVQSRLIALIYPELRRIAEVRMRSERVDHTLQPTALVNEFFIHLARQKNIAWKGRSHFLAVASKAMRRLLVDHARAHNAEKRGGGVCKLQLDAIDMHMGDTRLDALDVDRLLERLAAEEPRMAQVLEYRCFGGLTHSEIAEALGIDERTAKRDWQVARAWLIGQLRSEEHDVERRVG